MDIQDTKKYIDAVEDYLDTGIDYCTNTIRYADKDDLRQLAQDSFHAGVKWCESQKIERDDEKCNLADVRSCKKMCPNVKCTVDDCPFVYDDDVTCPL